MSSIWYDRSSFESPLVHSNLHYNELGYHQSSSVFISQSLFERINREIEGYHVDFSQNNDMIEIEFRLFVELSLIQSCHELPSIIQEHLPPIIPNLWNEPITGRLQV